MKYELSDNQVKALNQILAKYYNGQLSVAAEASVITNLANVFANPIKEDKPKDPKVTPVPETKEDGTQK